MGQVIFLEGNAVCASDIFLWYSTAKQENCCAYTTKWWSIVRACRGFIPFFFLLLLSLSFSPFLCLFYVLSCSSVAYNDEIDTWYRETLPSVIFSPTRESSFLYFRNRAVSGKTETEIFPRWKYSRLSIISTSIRFHSTSPVGFAYVASQIDLFHKIFSKNEIDYLCSAISQFVNLICKSVMLWIYQSLLSIDALTTARISD